MFGMRIVRKSDYENEKSNFLNEIRQKDLQIIKLSTKIIDLEKTNYNPRAECDGCENLIVFMEGVDPNWDIAGLRYTLPELKRFCRKNNKCEGYGRAEIAELPECGCERETDKDTPPNKNEEYSKYSVRFHR